MPGNASEPEPDAREITPADRVRIAHEKSAGAAAQGLDDDERGAKIVALIAGVLLAATGFYAAAQMPLVPYHGVGLTLLLLLAKFPGRSPGTNAGKELP